MNVGKIFESQIQKSVPDYALLYRISDSANSFGGNNNLRFSSKNPFDFILWDSSRHILYALELKTTAGKSISFERSKDDSGKIHCHQIQGLNIWNSFDGVCAGLIIEFRAFERTIFLRINEFNKLSDMVAKKSFSLEDLETYNIRYLVIPQKKARTRFSYDIDWFLKNN